MKWISVFLVALLAFVPTTSFWPERAEAQGRGNAARAGSLTVPVTGTATVPGTTTANPLVGAVTITRFAVQDGALVALGTLVGTVTDAAGTTVRTIATSVAIPVAASGSGGAAACDILHLVLGPLHLDLLGLVIDLNQVELDIVAQPGPGNLLGNLLCAIVGLLDPPGPLAQLAQLLNQLLALLGG